MSDLGLQSARRWRRPQHLSSVPYLPGLDGMRALAVMVVMVYHANVSWLKGGFLGVEVFFVISGYLITLLLMAETERTGRVDLVAFWGRRARRLLPALFALLLVVSAYTAIFRADWLSDVRGDVIAALLYVSNWWQIWIGVGYATKLKFAPLEHLWSLAVEEQFYLFWPVVMLLLLRRGSRRLGKVALALLVIALAITVANSLFVYTGKITDCVDTPDAYWKFTTGPLGGRCFNKPQTLYLSTISRAGGLLIGSAFAMLWRPVAIMRGPLREANKLLDVLGLLGLVALGVLTWWMYFIDPASATTDPWLFPLGFLATDIATVVVIASVTHRYTLMGRALGNPVLVWIGQRSYGLYLYHWFIYMIFRRVTGINLSVVQLAAALAITVVVTEISYRFLESPIRKREVGSWWAKIRRQSDPRPRQTMAALALVVVGLASFSVFRMATAGPRSDELGDVLAAGTEESNSFDDVLSGEVVSPTTQPIVPVVTQPAKTTTPGTTEPTTPPSTTQPLPDGKIDFLAVGDSVMLGAAPYLKEKGWTVVAAQNRQMKDAIPFLEELKAQERIGQPVLIHLGTNGPISEETVDQLMNALAGSSVVVLFNVHGNLKWRDGNNRVLAERDNPNDNIILIDWNTRAASCPGDCFYDDGIHLKPDGQKYYEKIATGVWFGGE